MSENHPVNSPFPGYSELQTKIHGEEQDHVIPGDLEVVSTFTRKFP